MSTSTARLQLHKPAPPETVDVVQDLNNNYDKIDTNIGLQVVTSGTRPASPYSGQLIYESDRDIVRFWDGDEWRDLSPRTVRKPATESVISSETLQDDDHLTLPVDANSEYMFTMILRYQAHAGADLKCQLIVPSGTTFRAVLHRLTSVASAEGDDRIDEVTSASNFSPGGIGSGTPTMAHMEGTLVVGATAGTIKLQWAQLASNAAATQILAGSFMTLNQYG